MKKRVLITAGVCLLGEGLLKTVPKDIELFLGFHTHKPKKNLKGVFIDVQNENSINKALSSIKPNIIIHTAAISEPDICQTKKDLAWDINVNGTKKLLNCAKKFSPQIIFISSNAIFDGLRPPYSERSVPKPINFYGQTKFEGEKLVRKSLLQSTILRLMTMYGWPPIGARDNPVTWKLKLLKENKTLYLVADKFLNPLYNIQAAESIWKAAQRSSKGIYHIAGKDTISRYEWGLKVAKIFGFEKNKVVPVNSDFFSNLAPRADNSTFDTQKMKKTLGILPLAVEDGLSKMKG